MKKLIKITAIVTLLFGLSVNAQSQRVTTVEGPSFGLRGGLNMSNMYVEDVDDENVLFGFNAGAFVEIPISSLVSIQPEIGFTTKGSEVRYDNAFAEGSTKFRLSYIEAPVLLRINVTRGFNLHAGPYVGYLVHAKITDEDSSGNTTNTEELNEDDLNRVDFGLAAGLGLELDNIGIGARYNYGLTTVGKERTILGQTFTSPDGKNSVLSIFATLRL